MDPTIDPFGTPDIAINPQPSPEDHAQIAGQWNDFLQDPKGRAALVNFGLALMQPVGLGQTPGGQIGQAVGFAGQGLQAQEEQERKAKETDIKSQLADERSARNVDRATYEGGILDEKAKTRGLTQLLGEQRIRAAEERLRATQQNKDNVQATRDAQQFRQYVKQESDKIWNSVSGVTGASLLPQGHPYRQYEGKSYGDITNAVASDPATRQRFEAAKKTGVAPAPTDGPDPAEGPQGDVSEPDSTSAPQQPFEGQTATNTSTGQKVIFKSGRWVYL